MPAMPVMGGGADAATAVDDHAGHMRSETTAAVHTAGDVIDAVRRLTPAISCRAREIEAARRLPDDLFADLKEAGCLRMLLPRSHSGLGVTLPAAMRVYEALARADASVAWTVANCSCAWRELAGLPRATFDAVFTNGTEVTVAGVFAPSGSAHHVDGGYRVNGRWGFASGCTHCDWLYANCVEEVDREKQLRTVLLSSSELTIEDTWTVSGMCGTGSHHVTADDVFVPVARTCPTLGDEPCVDVPLAHIPSPPLFALAIAGTALGVAQGALDDILAIAGDKTPLLEGAPLAANPLFQYQLGQADTDLRAARVLAYQEAGSAWALAADRAGFTMQQRAWIRATAVWVTARAMAVVDFAYHAGGGSAVYATNALQRRLRDIHAITQHFLVRPDTLTTVGAALAGQDVDLPVF